MPKRFQNEFYSDRETEALANAALKRMFGTPPKPRKFGLVGKRRESPSD
jgi:hypothetical protein